jgi:hypothetical protein
VDDQSLAALLIIQRLFRIAAYPQGACIENANTFRAISFRLPQCFDRVSEDQDDTVYRRGKFQELLGNPSAPPLLRGRNTEDTSFL